MALNIELRSEDGTVESRIVGDTAPLELVAAVSDLQAPVFAAELRSHAEVLADAVEREPVEAIVARADRRAEDVHTCLWLISD